MATPDPDPVGSDWDGVVPAPGAQAVAGPADAPGDADSSSVALGGDPTRLHVKFHESARVRLDDGRFTTGGVAEPALDQALAGVAGLRVSALFDRPEADLRAERREAERLGDEPFPDLTAWFLIVVADPADGRRLVAALEALAVVEMVQPEPALAPTAPIEEERQGYLNSTPTGVDAEWSWGRSAGTGSQVTIAVIDSGFDTDHPDLDRASGPGVAIPHEPAWDPHHGLQVLGILVADDDGEGIRGIASGAGIRTVNSGRTSGQVANAIDLAAGAVGAGDVITISQGICAVAECADSVVLPLVFSSSARDALRVAAGRGIITVVSGGNGGASLDNYSSRLGADAPDTIVVGAGNPAAGACTEGESPARGRHRFSNYGARIDLQGWGACVRTTAQGGAYRWWGFTSAATPIVAGAAALLSSVAQQRLGRTLSGDQVRSLLSEFGSSQVTAGARGGRIGPLPDLRSAVAALDRIPANDLWGAARAVPDLPFSVVSESRWAGVQVAEPAVLCGSISHTVWYQITPSDDLDLTIDTAGSDHDTIVGLWRSRRSGLERVACNDNIGTNNNRSRLTRTLVAGDTYYIQVGGAAGSSGRLVVRLSSGSVIDTGCDIDNDGRGDVLTGSPYEDVRRQKNAGRAVVDFGHRSGRPRRVTSITQEWPGVTGGSEKGDRFGASVACGDFDGDGFDDIAIGGPREDVDGRNAVGAVRVIPGSARGVSESGAITITQASQGIAGKNEAGDEFGDALAVGDFNGDGYDDLAIGSSGEDIGRRRRAGAVHVILGGPDGIDTTRSTFFSGDADGLPNRAEADDRFGEALVAADFDGDGYDDLAVGAPGESLARRSGAGAVFVMPGSNVGVRSANADILHQAVRGVSGRPEAGDRFGAALAAGDFDADGLDDLAVGVPGEALGGFTRAGMVTVFSGRDRGLRGPSSTSIHQGNDDTADQLEAGDRFGAALAAGDFDGDGDSDLAVGVPGQAVDGASRAGMVHVFNGSSDGVASGQTITQAGPDIVGTPETGDRLGTAVAIVDINGDGFGDLVAGVPKEDVGGVRNAGYIVLVPGSSSGLDPTGSRGLSQKKPATGDTSAGDRFGQVAS